jgi:RNA polymerase sigma-70 factor (ECF subfamily)
VQSEETLVAACLRKESQAFTDFIQRFHDDVFRLCFRMLGNRSDAEDIYQESFLRIFRYLHRWDSSRPLKPWILQVTANRCRTWLSSRRKSTVQLESDSELADRKTGEESNEMAREISRAVKLLREDYRQVFILYHEEALDYLSISEAIGKPVGTIKTWLHRARLEVLETLRSRGMLEISQNDVRI